MDINFDSIAGIPSNLLDDTQTKPAIIIGVIVILIIYYMFFSGLGENITAEQGNPSFSARFLEITLWGVVVMLIMSSGLMFLFNTDINASTKNIMSSSPEIDVVIETDDSKLKNAVMSREKEVFHIPGNKYNYDDAKAVCISYGGRLATYQEISDSYDKGADWCSYGWSDGQMALFPTQKLKWENLQSIDGHENDCGRPGINGGYIENPNVMFGVNCYGYKPDITPEEQNQMENATLYQKTQKEVAFENKVDYWRSKIPEIILSPFNHRNWSVFNQTLV
tara:strand:+ start:2687 stop:3523 length:837 start_codon:yes stop_codon:yes gene_type:complete